MFCYVGSRFSSRNCRERRYQSKMETQVGKVKCVIWFIETHSATTVQRLYRKVPATRKSFCAWRKQFEETGCLCKGKSPGRPRVADATLEALLRSYVRSRRNQQTVLLVSETHPSQLCGRFYAID
jgi:hypothetical protein